MGGGTTSSTSSSAPSNPAVTSTLNQLLGTSPGGVQGIFKNGPQVFNQSTYNPAGATTQNAWAQSLGAANNPQYAAGINGAIANQGNQAAGNGIGINDPAYQAMRDKLSSDVMGQVGSQFTNSGRFGGGSYIKDATSDLTSSLGNLDWNAYTNGQQQQQDAIHNLPGLFQAAQAPAATAGAIGTAQDTNQQGILTGNADLYSRQHNANLNLLQQLMGTVGGGAQAGGTTTTSTQPAPSWWQTALGLGVSLL